MQNYKFLFKLSAHCRITPISIQPFKMISKDGLLILSGVLNYVGNLGMANCVQIYHDLMLHHLPGATRLLSTRDTAQLESREVKFLL